jgi:hypothetical protein
VYVAPWGCGQPGGLSLGPFDNAEQAIAAADRDVRPRRDAPYAIVDLPRDQEEAQLATDEVWASR